METTMNKEKLEKVWQSICDEVEMNVEKKYMSIPIGKRNQLGVEPNEHGNFNDVDSYERNRWLVCYISLLESQKKAWQIFSAENRFDKDS